MRNFIVMNSFFTEELFSFVWIYTYFTLKKHFLYNTIVFNTYFGGIRNFIRLDKFEKYLPLCLTADIIIYT